MLTLRSKTPVRFEFSDGVQETTVTIQPDEESESLRAKLQRVLDLEAPHMRAAISATGAVNVKALRPPQGPAFTPADRAAEEARLAGAGVMGWNEDAVDGAEHLPEY